MESDMLLKTIIKNLETYDIVFEPVYESNTLSRAGKHENAGFSDRQSI